MPGVGWLFLHLEPEVDGVASESELDGPTSCLGKLDGETPFDAGPPVGRNAPRAVLVWAPLGGSPSSVCMDCDNLSRRLTRDPEHHLREQSDWYWRWSPKEPPTAIITPFIL